MQKKTSADLLSHHAHLLIGGEEVRADVVETLTTQHKITVQANPDFFDLSFETFGIEDAREVKARAGIRPVHSDAKKIFILVMKGITVEAQNALLKILEEPPAYAHFFIIVPSAYLLLPTVKSRLRVLEVGDRNADACGDDIRKEAAAFIKMTPAKRLDAVKTFMESITKEKRPRHDVIDFLNAVQALIYKERGIREGKEALQSIETARGYATDRAPSLKMLLEYVALSV